LISKVIKLPFHCLPGFLISLLNLGLRHFLSGFGLSLALVVLASGAEGMALSLKLIKDRLEKNIEFWVTEELLALLLSILIAEEPEG